MELSSAVLKTLAYADVFDYPLTKEELYQFLIHTKPVSKTTFEQVLKKLPPQIVYKQGFYCLKTREALIATRKKRMAISKKKRVLAEQIASKLRLFPTVLCVGLSGGLAMHNTDEHDDIDFFIITRHKTLWLTRFCLVFYLRTLGVLRKRQATLVKNKICLNMFLDEQALALPVQWRNLYTAHEVVQVKPLIDKHHTFARFLAANNWVQTYVPNSVANLSSVKKERRRNLNKGWYIFEFIAKKCQLWYMKNKQTRETISDEMLAFHPFDYQTHILSAYQQRLKRYGQTV